MLHQQAQLLKSIDIDHKRRSIDNDVSPAYLQSQLVEQLPRIAQSLPKPDSLKIYEGAEGSQLTHLFESVLETIECIKKDKS